MPEFHNTLMGKRFIEGTMPSIMQSLDRIADVLEKMNALEKMNEEPKVLEGDGLFIDELKKVSPEVQGARKCASEDVMVSKSAIIKAAAEKAGMTCTDIKMSDCGRGIPEVQEALKGITNSQVLKFLNDGGTISNIRAWRYISNAMRIDNVGEIITLVNIYFGEEVANKFFDYISPKEATDDTN